MRATHAGSSASTGAVSAISKNEHTIQREPADNITHIASTPFPAHQSWPARYPLDCKMIPPDRNRLLQNPLRNAGWAVGDASFFTGHGAAPMLFSWLCQGPLPLAVGP